MSWFADLAGRAENLLTNLDEQTGAALRNHNVPKPKILNKNEVTYSDPIGQRKRPTIRNSRKLPNVSEPRSNITNNAPQISRKPSPSRPLTNLQNKDSVNSRDVMQRGRKTLRKPSSQLYHLENCPKTLVDDAKDSDQSVDQSRFRDRRYSLPSDLELINKDNITFRMQNLEVENAMLKNEINVMNREVADMLDRLHKTEDGNDVVNSNKALDKAQTKLEDKDNEENVDKELLGPQLQELKHKIDELTNGEIAKYKEQKEMLEAEVDSLTQKNKELEESINEINEKGKDNTVLILKLETDLRHAQSVINDLQNNVDKSTAECQRLEKDWDTYKVRVKSMLNAKDNEIREIHEGLHFTEDSKMLLHQIEDLKQEREDLSEAISRLRDECSDMRHQMEQLESRNNSAERVVTALRDALKDERAARNKAESHCLVMGKELKSIQIETAQTIASLRGALLEKENEMILLKDTMSSSIQSTDNSVSPMLNVADYDNLQASIDNEKIHYLTEMLVQKQGKIDKLLADNNTLKIQLEKLESKYKSEVTLLRANSHSVVHVQDGDSRGRPRSNKAVSGSALSVLSLRIGVLLKRYPIFRVFIVAYMIFLHFWVLTVLFTSTPEDFLNKATKL